MDKERLKGIAFVLSATVIYALQSLIVPTILKTGVSSMSLSGVKLVSGTISVFIVMVIMKKKFIFRKKDLGRWLVFGILGGTAFAVLLNASYGLSGASQTMIFLYTAPAFSVILARIYLKEKITLKKTIAVFLVVLGIVAVALGSEGGMYPLTPLGFLVGIGAGMAYGVFNILAKKMSATYDSFNVNFFYVLIAALVAIPLVPIGDWAVTLTSPILPLMLLYGASIYGLGNLLFMKSYDYLEAGEAILFANMEPILAVSLATIFLGERLAPIQLVGFACVLGALFLISFSGKRKGV